MARAVPWALLLAILGPSGAARAQRVGLNRHRGVFPSQVVFNPTSVTGGTNSTGTVTINQPAPSGGISVSLHSSDPSLAVPPSVTVPGGSVSQTFTPTTVGVATAKNVQVTASIGSSAASGSLTVNPATIGSLTLAPGSLAGGGSSTGTVTLSGPAPPAGLTVTLTSNNTSAVTVPASFTIAGGATSGTFQASSAPVAANTAVNITATLPSGTAASSALTVIPPVVTLLSFSPASVVSGQMATGTVTLNGNAPAGGMPVSLTSSNSSALPLPATVLVPAGSSSQTFTVTASTVTSSTSVTATAATGATAVTAGVTVLPAILLTGVAFNPIAVTGGTNSTGTVTINQAAPAGGIAVSLSSSDASVTVPASVTVVAGSVSQTFSATTVGIATAKNVQVTASMGSSTANASLTVNPPTIASFSVAPASVTGGNASTGTVALSGPAPQAGLTVTLTSNNTSAVTAPASFTIAGGATSGTFQASSAPVAANTAVNITATLPSGTAASAALTVIPPVVTLLSFGPATIVSGQMATGTVTLNGNAPSGGIAVNLSSSAPSVVSVPASVAVPAGSNSQTFVVTPGAVSTATSVTLTAASGSVSVTALLTVNPNPGLTVSPSSLAFGSTLDTVTSSPQSVTLANNTGASVTITSITASANFGQVNNCPAALAAVATCTIVVTFTPSQAGNLSGSLTVASSAGNSTVSLSGTGVHWIGLNWMPSSTPSVTGYNVYRRISSGSYASPINASLVPASACVSSGGVVMCSYADSDPSLVAGTTYLYEITAVDGSGAQSAPSNEASVVFP